MDAIKSLVTPTPEGDWFSTGVSFEAFELITALFQHSSNGKSHKKTQVYTTGNPYGIAEDIVFSMPCRSKVRSTNQIVLIIFVLRLGTTPMIIKFFQQGDGDYELATDVSMDDFLWERIKKVRAIGTAVTDMLRI